MKKRITITQPACLVGAAIGLKSTISWWSWLFAILSAIWSKRKSTRSSGVSLIVSMAIKVHDSFVKI